LFVAVSATTLRGPTPEGAASPHPPTGGKKRPGEKVLFTRMKNTGAIAALSTR